MFVSPDIYPYIVDFQVHKDEVIPVHANLSIYIQPPGNTIMKNMLKTPTSMYQVFLDHIRQKHNIAEGDQVGFNSWQEEISKLHEYVDKQWDLVKD
eukprot:6496447-Karenia_brevis.AAC.1